MAPGLLTERWFAKTYGWPPEVVNRLPLPAVHWFPIIEQASERAAKIEADQRQKPGGGRGRR